MHVKLGSALLLLLTFSTSSALAQTNDWATCTSAPAACSTTSQTCCKEAASTNLGIGGATNKPIIIPMDRCHQTVANNDYPGSGSPSTSANGGWCSDNAATNADGMFHAYGLVYRLMQRGVPVYWLVNPTKTASPNNAWDSSTAQRYTEKDIDLWLLSSGATIPSVGTALSACTGACVPPVVLLKTVSGALVTNTTWTYSKQEFPLRGGAFFISSTDRAAFDTFWDAYGDGAPGAGRICGQTTDCYNFTNVRLYEVNAGTTAAWRNHLTSTNITDSVPVAVKLTYQPPRIARVEPGGSVSEGWLKAANLNDKAASGCETGVFSPSDSVWCRLTETQVNDNVLVSGGFGWAWLDGGNAFTSCSKVLRKMRTFMSSVPGLWNAGNVMANDTQLADVEACANYQLLGNPGAATQSLATSGTAVNEQKSGSSYKPMLVRYPTNLFMQYGDFTLDFASSSVAHWTTNGTYKYNALYTGASNTLKRLITREDTGTASNRACGDANTNNDLADSGELAHSWDVYPQNNVSGCDVAPTAAAGDKEDLMAYGRLENSALNGVIFYSSGNQIGNKSAQLRMVLNSLIAVPSGGLTQTPTTSTEVARSTPIVPQLDVGSGAFDAVVQGTAVYQTPVSSPKQVLSDADASTFAYPYRMGHMRARRASDSSLVFDAGCNDTVGGAFACPSGTAGIPSTALTYDNNGGTSTGCTFPKSASNSNCRTIFTSTASGDLRATSLVYFDKALPTAGKNLIKLGSGLSNTSVETIIQRVIAGYDISGTKYPRLGGVNRSTVAVIPPSVIAGDLGRPLMAYFGAEDGMLHAVCAEVNSARGCDVLGRELWAYIPRTALPYLRFNAAHIEGSPRVIDAKIDYDGSGGPTWRTVLMFQTGFGDATADGRQGAVYALDVSDPRSPTVLWEYSMNVSSRTADELGVGLGLAAGPIVNGTSTDYWVWAQTTNGGTNALTGTVVTAIDIETGLAKWKTAYTYSSNPRTSTNDPVVRTAIPGGAVPVDLTSSGKVTDVTFTDLYGSLWLIDPLTGVSRTGTNLPLFTLDADYHSIGASPSIFTPTGSGSQYAVFTTGGYADPSNTTWPLECCYSTDGSSCAGTQPASPTTCAQYNNSTLVMPLNYAVAVKLDSTVTATQTSPTSQCDNDTGTGTIPDCTAPLYFKKNLGPDQRGYVSPLIIGTQIFFTTDAQNVNRYDYTGGANIGSLYTFNTDTGTAIGSTVMLTTGATGLGISNNAGVKTVYGSTNSGTFFTATHDGSTAPAVEKADTFSNGASRKAWLRLE